MKSRVAVCTQDEIGGPGDAGLRGEGWRLSTLVIDLDGVLVDSRHQMMAALEQSYRTHCGPGTPPFEEFFALMGMPLDDILARLELPAAMAKTYREASRQALDLVRVFPGVPELLHDARQSGLSLALMTGKDRARSRETLDRFGLTRFFDAFVCGDDPFPGKPQPDGLVHLLAVLNGHSAEAALLGDSPLDMRCAVAAHVAPIGAEWGVSNSAELLAAGARATFASPLDFGCWLQTIVAPPARQDMTPTAVQR